tara:strand:- start:870 stop:1211 length:342 start_codon:yes stop_codon:yes gene_type:complete
MISKGKKVTAKAHGGAIDIQGITVAKVVDKVRLQSVETWFDPMEMFRQIAPTGEVTKTAINAKPGEYVATLLYGAGMGSVEEEQYSASSVATVAAQEDVRDAISAACPLLSGR